jgi:exosome complex RNA-binding protein Rrp42 (RNase PH superfamily)
MSGDLTGVRLSPSEIKFIYDGIAQGLRADGRSLFDARHMFLRLSLLPNANGSCRLRIRYSTSDVLCGIKLEIAGANASPFECNVELGALARSDLLGPVEASKRAERRGVELADKIRSWLERSLTLPTLIDEKSRWVCQIDFTVLGDGGNLHDLLFLACYCALRDTRIPDVIVNEDGTDFDISPEFSAARHLEVDELSLPVSCWFVANKCLIDPSAEEESCAGGACVVECAKNGDIKMLSKLGNGAYDSALYFEAISAASAFMKRVLKFVDMEMKSSEKKQSMNMGRLVFDDANQWNLY